MLLLFLIGLYFLPAMIAYGRDMKNSWSVFFLNLFFGWTAIGWVAALCWAVAGTAELKSGICRATIKVRTRDNQDEKVIAWLAPQGGRSPTAGASHAMTGGQALSGASFVM